MTTEYTSRYAYMRAGSSWAVIKLYGNGHQRCLALYPTADEAMAAVERLEGA